MTDGKLHPSWRDMALSARPLAGDVTGTDRWIGARPWIGADA